MFFRSVVSWEKVDGQRREEKREREVR